MKRARASRNAPAPAANHWTAKVATPAATTSASSAVWTGR